jgi:hypothetical protein
MPGRNGHSAGEDRSRSGIHNVKEPGAQARPHLEQIVNETAEGVKQKPAVFANVSHFRVASA